MVLHTSGPVFSKADALDALEALPIDQAVATCPSTGRVLEVGHLHFAVVLDRMTPMAAATYLVLAGLPIRGNARPAPDAGPQQVPACSCGHAWGYHHGGYGACEVCPPCRGFDSTDGAFGAQR